MSQELLQKAEAVVRGARARGAEGVRVTIGRSRMSRVEWRDDALERVRENTTMQLGLTLYVDGRYSAHGTSDLRPEALEAFLDETVAMTRLLARDPHRGLPDAVHYEGMFSGDLGQYDAQGAAALSGVDRRRLAQSLAAAAREAPGGDRIVSVASGVTDTESESVLVNSNGMEGTRQMTTFSLFADCTVRDEGHRKPRGYWFSYDLRRDLLESVEAVGAEATRRALAQVGARPLESGIYACVIENSQGERLLGNLVQALSGANIEQQRSFLADELGERIASPVLTATEEPHIVGGFGSRAYDEEGMASRSFPIIERGVLRNFYLDTYYARKLQMAPTTSSPSNVVFDLGKRDLDGLLQAMGTGILITTFRGGNANSATGDFSIGIGGHRVENGRIVRPVTEMNLAGNQIEFWKQLAEMGNDPFRYSHVRCPSLRFAEVQFSGV
ncbi:MAG: TldD/PmbA family protein [Candidatus Eisenbacteria bacterium]|nr:TldD/PmbA family protein [Candidatus Eisenbacteria bacterium]